MASENKRCCLCGCCKKLWHWFWGKSLAPLLVGVAAFFATILAIYKAPVISAKIDKLFKSTQKIEGITKKIEESNKEIKESLSEIKKAVLALQENAKAKSSKDIVNSISKDATPEQIKKKLKSKLGYGGRESRPWGMYMDENNIKKVAEEFKNVPPADKAILQNKIFENIIIPEMDW